MEPPREPPPFFPNDYPPRLVEYCLDSDNNPFPDVVILEVGDEKFPARRTALEGPSPVLKALFSETWARDEEKRNYTISDEVVKPEIVEDLLIFIHTGVIAFHPDNIEPLCVAADFLDIPTVVAECENYLCQQVSPEAAMELYSTGLRFNMNTLRQRCVIHLCANFETSLDDAKLNEISAEDLKTLMSEMTSQRKYYRLKEVLLQFLFRWAQNTDCFSSFPGLLASFPLKELSYEFLYNFALKEKLMVDSNACEDIVSSALIEISENDQPSLPPNTDYLYCIGESHSHNDSYSLFRLNVFTEQWETVGEYSGVLPCKAKFTLDTVIINNKVFIFGDRFQYPRITVYDYLANTYSSLDFPYWCFDKVSKGYAVTAFNGLIYVTGGESKLGIARNTVESYDYVENKWRQKEGMASRRSFHHLLTIKDCLYAIGGDICNTAERYDPVENKWKIVAGPLNETCSTSSAIVHDDRIYFCSTIGFEVYDPELNTWKSLAPLPKNWCQTLVSYNGRILALGGLTSRNRSSSVSFNYVYDQLFDQWIPSPEVGRVPGSHGLFVVNF